MAEEKQILSDEEINKLDLTKIESELCRRSFFYFCKEFWETFDPAKACWEWYHEYLCNQLQEVGMRLCRAEDKTEDIIINQPPGTSKSSIVSVLYNAWLWTISPKIKIICASYAQAISLDLSTKCRTVVTSDKYKLYFPYVSLKDDQQGKSDFYTTKGGMRFSTSVGSAVTGKHADLILVDDPLNINDIFSEKDRDAANQWVNNLSTRKTNNETSLTILVAQRLHPLDTTNYLLSQGTKYKQIVLPAELNGSLRPGTLKSYYDEREGLLDPKRLSRRILEEKKKALQIRGYNAQYLQSPADDSESMIKEKWFEIISKEQFNKFIEGKPYVVDFFVDSAYTTNKKRNDPSVILAVSKIGEIIYILNLSRQWFEITQFIDHLKAFALQNGYSPRSRIYIEPKASGLSIFQTLQQQTGLNVIKSASYNYLSKFERLNAIAPILNSERVKLIKGSWNIDFLGEVCTEESQHDDIKDCLSCAVNQLLTKSKGTGKYTYAFC